MDEPLLECAFLIPVVRDSDRRLHPPIAWRDLEDALRRSFSGRSGPQRTSIIRDIELVPGEYVARTTGRPVEDESRRYMVAVREDSVEELRSLLRKAANTFDQESIYLSVRGLVEFIQPRPEDGFL